MPVTPATVSTAAALVVPTLLSWGASSVITDLKGELWALTAGWRQKHAKNKVLRFEPASTSGGVCWNPLDEIRLGTEYEVGDVQKLGMWRDVNGQRMQTGNTATMVFNVAQIVSYLSQFMTLMPGDVITTGTPPGVGLGMKPPVFLKPGDEMRLGIQGLGEQHQKVHAWDPALIDN